MMSAAQKNNDKTDFSPFLLYTEADKIRFYIFCTKRKGTI